MLRLRPSYAPEARLEMMPLLDVIFLLLTFFIYSLVVMVRVQILPVSLPTIESGEAALTQHIVGITIDKDGQYFVNQEEVALANLVEAVNRYIEAAGEGTSLFVAMDQEGTVDRGPALIELIEMLHANDIHNFSIVGRPKGESVEEE